MKVIEIYNEEVKINQDIYNFIIRETWFDGWGIIHSKGRAKPKTYEIKKNNETILSTNLYQSYYASKRKIMKGGRQ